MKSLLVFLTTLMATTGFAADFYECSGFDDVEEYRVGVDFKKNQASFFDNDTTSVLPFTDLKFIETLPPKTLYIFEGEDKGTAGRLEVTFNATNDTANLVSVSADGSSRDMGTVKCVATTPW